jgi:hypothetical protein
MVLMENNILLVARLLIALQVVESAVGDKESHVQGLEDARAIDKAEIARIHAYSLGVEPKVYMYDVLAMTGVSNDQLLKCYNDTFQKYPWENEKEDAQNSADIWLYYAIRSHKNRVRDPAEADIFFIPFLPRISFIVDVCNGTTANSRKQTFMRAMAASKWHQRKRGADHVLVCQSWECKTYLKGLEFLRKGYLAIHERNPTWGNHWAKERMIIIPYVPSITGYV